MHKDLTELCPFEPFFVLKPLSKLGPRWVLSKCHVASRVGRRPKPCPSMVVTLTIVVKLVETGAKVQN